MSQHQCLEWRTGCGVTGPFEAEEYTHGYDPGDEEPCVHCDSPVEKACVAVVHISTEDGGPSPMKGNLNE